MYLKSFILYLEVNQKMKWDNLLLDAYQTCYFRNPLGVNLISSEAH